MLSSTIARSRSAIVAGIVALSVAVVPADRAEAQDNSQVAAGIATLAIIGALIAHQAKADEKKDKEREKKAKKEREREKQRAAARARAPAYRHDPHPGWRSAPPRQQHAHRPAQQRHFWEHPHNRRDPDRRHDHRR